MVTLEGELPKYKDHLLFLFNFSTLSTEPKVWNTVDTQQIVR